MTIPLPDDFFKDKNRTVNLGRVYFPVKFEKKTIKEKAFKITGKAIYENSGKPILNANITVEQNNNIIVTNNNGDFEILEIKLRRDQKNIKLKISKDDNTTEYKEYKLPDEYFDKNAKIVLKEIKFSLTDSSRKEGGEVPIDTLQCPPELNKYIFQGRDLRFRRLKIKVSNKDGTVFPVTIDNQGDYYVEYCARENEELTVSFQREGNVATFDHDNYTANQNVQKLDKTDINSILH